MVLLHWLTKSFCFVFIDFLLIGFILSYMTKKFAERYLRKSEKRQIHAQVVASKVEPLYAFDIHCNGFFPIILFCYFINVS
jgi:hypothetical protein